MLHMTYTDLDEARDALSRMASIYLTEPADPVKFHMQGSFLVTDKLTIFRAATMTGYHARYQASLDDMAFLVQRNTLYLDTPSNPLDTNAESTIFVDRRNAERKSVPAMTSQKGMLIEAATLTHSVSDRLGEGDLNRITFTAGGMLPALHLTCENICDTLYTGLAGHGGLVANPLAVANLQDALINTILYSAQHSYSDALMRGSLELPRVIRRAIDFIHANAHLPITPTEVAVACGLSIRSLQLTFRERLEITPKLYIRRVRLRLAYEDLKAGQGQGVGDIARKWGFQNRGEFARLFHAEFGEKPGDIYRR